MGVLEEQTREHAHDDPHEKRAKKDIRKGAEDDEDAGSIKRFIDIAGKGAVQDDGHCVVEDRLTEHKVVAGSWERI